MLRPLPGGGCMHIRSAPSSDAALLRSALPLAPASPGSPSKADRLNHLKRLQAHRRAQSAGVPSVEGQLQTSHSFLKTLSSPTRTFLDSSNGNMEQASAEAYPESTDEHSGLPADFEVKRFWSTGKGVVSLPHTIHVETLGQPVRSPDTPSHTRGSTADLLVTPALHGSESLSPCSRGAQGEIHLSQTQPSRHPEADLASNIEAIMRANTAKRQDLDWLKHQEAINGMRILLCHHSDVVQSHIRAVLAAMLPCTAALRSSTLRTALHFFQVLVVSSRPCVLGSIANNYVHMVLYQARQVNSMRHAGTFRERCLAGKRNRRDCTCPSKKGSRREHGRTRKLLDPICRCCFVTDDFVLLGGALHQSITYHVRS
jgi:hypothetical protein